jgi:peroxiredoxin
MTTSTDPVAWLTDTTASHPLTVLVFFRGNWCPFCQAYLREMNGDFHARVRAAGGELIAVTSQSEASAQKARADWGVAYRVMSEPSNALARRFDVAITPKAETVLADDPVEYPEGMAQPAVVALDQGGEVLFRWAIEPAAMNLGGASDRPLPMDIWPVIEAALAGEERALDGSARVDPAFLKAHYPEAHAAFAAWIAQANAADAK